MTKSWIFAAAFALMAAPLLVTGCSAQGGGGGGTLTTASGQSCNIDAKRICEQVALQNVKSSQTGLLEGSREQQQDSALTEEISVPYTFPSGATANLTCNINAARRNVVYASIQKGAPLTDSDMEFLKSNGFCGSSS